MTCFFGNYLQQTPIRIWKRYIPLLIDLLISNNFSSMTFFAQRVASGGVIVHIFLIFDNNSINNKATTLCLHK